MTKNPDIVDEAEAVVSRLAAELTLVRPGECLYCYVWRQLGDYPCDGTHRHALRFRDARAPRATALRDRLSRLGACCCDCEIFNNAYQPRPHLWTPRREVEQDGVVYEVEPEPPDELPACTGVRRGSVQPCAHWSRVWRPWR